jgi:hypothetical protein
MTTPIESHSACFSGYSAGKEEEPGRVIPRASVAEAIVFAVYIYNQRHHQDHSLHRKHLHLDKHFV